MWFVIGLKRKFKYTVVFVEREVRKGDNHLDKEWLTQESSNKDKEAQNVQNMKTKLENIKLSTVFFLLLIDSVYFGQWTTVCVSSKWDA